MAIYETAQSKTNAELLELEQQLRDETDAKLKEDHQLATLRNEEAMLRMELEEIIAVCLALVYFVLKFDYLE